MSGRLLISGHLLILTTCPLMELMKGSAKDRKWTNKTEQVSAELKELFTSTLILAHFTP